MIRALAIILLLTSSPVFGQSAPSASEAEFLVAPQGGAFDVPIRIGDVCLLSFPEKMVGRALSSSPSFEIKAWGDDGVAVRASTTQATRTTLALATVSGMKVNITLTVVPPGTPALTMVRFKAASAEEAFEAQVKDAVGKRLGPLETELAAVKRELDIRARDRADALVLDRILRRNETFKLSAHGRNDDHVIVHVIRGQLLGQDGYVMFDIQNRSNTAYRVASVSLAGEGRDVGASARLVTPPQGQEPMLIGVVPAGGTVRGAIHVRGVDAVLGVPLALEIAGPAGRGKVRVDYGIILR